MNRAVAKILITIAISGCLFLPVFSQTHPVKNYAIALNNLRELKPIEKLYLQTDKPNYSIGDTLRFKAYLLYADFLTPDTNSGLLYIELTNNLGKSVKRSMVPVNNGLAWGNVVLDSTEIPHGTYTLRAYTNWMRNFGEDYIFKKNIIISKYSDNPALVNAVFKQTGNSVEADLQFSLLNGRIPAFRDVELKVMNGKRNISKDKVITGPDGTVNVNFKLPEGPGALSILAAVAGSGTLSIPVSIKRKENTDIQFMPEGGSLIARVPCKVGFKAIGEDGKGVDVKGVIFDSKGKQITQFAATHAGMGSFEFTPLAGEIYTAKVDGIVKAYTLPPIKQSGTAIAVNLTKSDSLQVKISATANANGVYTLIGQARGVVCFAQTVNVSSNSSVAVARSLFPTGIARFTLFNNFVPLNERIVFINQQDNLNITITSNKSSYSTRDSIAIDIQVKDKDGQPVEGNFSLAVTDDSQVKPDSMGVNILNYLLLTSDLKGDIEDPGYYFTGDKATELDNLMLTQGWTGYNWSEVFQPKLPNTYKPEKEFVVSGKVTTAFGKSIEKSNVILIANNPLTFKDTITDNTGRFVFKDLFPVDTAIFKLQARNKRGREMNVKIQMDEDPPPVFTPPLLSMPWYVNIDSSLLNNVKARVDEAAMLSHYRGEGNVLKEVNIKAKKIIKGSKNLNGPGEADQIIDEEELVKANKLSLAELLEQKVKGYSFVKPTKQGPLYYTINGREISLIIDGYNINYFYTGRSLLDKYHFMKTYMDYFTAEDITGIEVMFNNKYIINYNLEYFSSGERMRMPPAPLAPIVYLEITTRSKQGPFMKVVPGTYLYKTLPFTLAKQFYSPKYNIKNKTTASGTDLRSTIFWEPNVITDTNGKATVSFFSADRPSKYTIILEGTTMDGQLGYGASRLFIKP